MYAFSRTGCVCLKGSAGITKESLGLLSELKQHSEMYTRKSQNQYKIQCKYL